MTAVLQRSDVTGTATSRDERRRRRRAVLVGLLFLGVGTAVTLASWTSDEKAVGAFSAAAFGVQGTTTGTDADFSAHSSSAAPLTFVTNPTTLSPGDTVYAPYYLRLSAGTTTPGTVRLTNVTGSDTNAAHLSYTLVRLPTTSTSCAATAVAAGPVLSSGAVTTGTVSGATPVSLDVGSPTTNPGPAVKLCLAVTADSGLVQGGGAQVTWTLGATSS